MTITELMSQYSSVTKIKKGGQKIVYTGTKGQKKYAIKIINNSNDPRVLQEIELVKSLNLINIPQIVDSGLAYDNLISENVLYIIEEFIDGYSLRDWLNNGNTFSLFEAVNVLDTLLDIEIRLEENKILHRDINPNNIMRSKNNDIYLIDFRLAKKLNATSLTQTAALHGPFTPGYAPHEQFANMKLEQDVRTDLFQIGVTIYECCTGKNPFIKDNDTIYQVISRTMTILPPILTLAGDAKGMFGQFVNMLMAKNQSQRPDSAPDAKRYLSIIKSTLEEV